MSQFLKCIVCSQTSTNHLFSLQCLHLICKECIEEKIKDKRHLKVENNNDFYFSCPLCEYPSDAGRSEVLALENLCKVPHILKNLLSHEFGFLSPKCFACKTRGINKISTFWCFQCVEYFCEECLSFHNSIPNLNKHNAYSVEEVKNDTNLLNKARELCDQHDMHLTKLCTVQGVVCCDSCISADHTDVCKGEHKHIKDSSANAVVDSKLAHLKASLSLLRQELCSEVEKSSTIEKDTKEFFTEERKQAQQKSQNLNQTLLEKTNCLLTESFKRTFCKLEKTEFRILALSQKKSILDNAADIVSCLCDGPDIRLFLEIKKIKNILKDAKVLLGEKEERLPMCLVSFHVPANNLIGAISFGKITEHQVMSAPLNPDCSTIDISSRGNGSEISESEKSVHCSYGLDESTDSQKGASLSPELREFQFGSKTFLLSRSIGIETGNSHVTGCDWKSDNEIVIVDQNLNYEIRVYNTNDGILISKIQLDKKPYSIATFSNNTCVVTFPKEEEIRIYNLNDNSLQKVVHVEFKCYGVYICSTCIVVAGNDTIALFDKNLSETGRLTVTGEDIRYITAYNNNLLFYSDLQGNTVYSTMGNGDNRFEYEENIKGPAGLVLDEFKNVYVCEKGESSIHVLSKSGSFLRKFKVGKSPSAVSVSKNKTKLCVISGGRKYSNLADIYV